LDTSTQAELAVIGRVSDEQIFVQLVHRHRAPLLSYTGKLVGGDPGHAEDVVQETFVRAWRWIHRLTTEQASVKGWLRRVAHNVAMDRHRMSQIRPAEVELEHADVAIRADDTEQVLIAVTVAQLLDSLWPEHRAVLIEVYLNDRTTAEAAEVLGLPIGTVKSRLHYALQRLRDKAAESMDDGH
jgi:RNA polymerase sigma-70 factor, ECF subfamily